MIPGYGKTARDGRPAASPLVLPPLDQISPHEAVAKIPEDIPVLILAGGRDARARPHEAEAILDRVRSHGTLSVFEGADHVRMLDADPARYRRLVLDFLDDLAGKRP